jgi:hypothetical protein
LSSQWRIAHATTYEQNPTALPDRANALAVDAPTAKVTFVFDFSAKTLSYTAQAGTYDYANKIFTPSGSPVSATGQVFINNSATNLSRFVSNYYQKNGNSGTNGYDLMYMGISAERAVSTANVTVKFTDQDGTEFKSQETVPDQVVGYSYSATSSQKASVKIGDNYYVLNPASPTSVSVASGGNSTLTLVFRKKPYFTDMIWNGTNAANGDKWSEWDENFISASTSTPTAYQKGTNVLFNGIAEYKNVLVNEILDLGAGNVSIGYPDYSWSGGGSFSGTGEFHINLTGSEQLSLGVTNNLNTFVNGGRITVNKQGALGSNIVVNGASTLIPAASTTFPPVTFNAETSIQCGDVVSSIAGMTVASGIKVSVSSSVNTNNDTYAFGFAPVGTLHSGAKLEFIGTGDVENKFGMTSQCQLLGQCQRDAERKGLFICRRRTWLQLAAAPGLLHRSYFAKLRSAADSDAEHLHDA